MGSGPPIDQVVVVYVAPKGMLRCGFLLQRSSGLGSKLDPVASRHGERSPKKVQTSSEKTELVKDAVSGPAGFVDKDVVSSPAKLQLRFGFATPPEEVLGLSYSGEVSPVLPSPVRYGDFFDASRVLEFDLKSWVEEVNQALDLGDAHGLKSPEIGPRPLQVYQRSCGRLLKPNKPSGPSPVASVATSLEAGSPEAMTVVPAVPPVASAAVCSDAAPPGVPVVRGKQIFFPSGIRGCSCIR
jgi:hypothetical protein